MSSILSITELRKMQAKDLLRELQEQASLVAKMRLGIKMKKEKDTGKYRREKKQISRMNTALTEKAYEVYEEKESSTHKKS
ncbi:50S ribosomal protein L29 [Patescibacteria group bacterium]|nr:50S ribosomal protein L29 [Patescibacteria group bacterium]